MAREHDSRRDAPDQPANRTNGLVLPGGGARGAYQAGVLEAIAELQGAARSPFGVIAGTSAGSLNAAVIASHAGQFDRGTRFLCDIWSRMHVGRVFRADTFTMIKSGLHWMAAMLFGGLGVANPRSLLDNRPLRRLLQEGIDFDAIESALEAGDLRALAVTVSGYTTALSTTFYQASDSVPPWRRSRREGIAERLRVDHLMASAAMPFIFPAVRVGGEYFGDGALRQTAPLSPAIHLGADRLLVVGVRDEADNPLPEGRVSPDYPSFGQIAGYMLDTLFMDSLQADIERLERVNHTLSLVPEPARAEDTELRPVSVMQIRPSRDIREIAGRHAHEFPRSVRALLRGVGALGAGGRQLVSYLLFQSGYCNELLSLGYRDAMDRREELVAFLDL